MKKINGLLLIVLLFTYGFSFVLPVFAQEANEAVLMTQESIVVAPYQDVVVKLYLDDIIDVVGFQFEFFYEKAYTIKSISLGDDIFAQPVYNTDIHGEFRINYSDVSTLLEGKTHILTIVFEQIASLDQTTFDLISINPSYRNILSQLNQSGLSAIENIAYQFTQAVVGKYGDINLDGVVDIIDVGLLQLYLAERITLNEGQKTLADVNVDGNLSIMDVGLIQLFIAGKISHLGPQPPDYVYYPDPTLYGVIENQSFYMGTDTYDPLFGVTAYDENDGDLTDAIEVIGTYNVSIPGVYTFMLRVVNSFGKSDSKQVTLRVHASSIPDTFDTQTTYTLDFWHAFGMTNSILLQSYFDAFKVEMMNTYGVNVELNLSHMGSYDTLRQQVIMSIINQNQPHLVLVYPDHIAEYIRGHAVVNLDPYVYHDTWGLHGADALDDIFTVYRDENSQYDTAKTFYSMPFNKSTEIMIYNKTVFDELGLTAPQTWQDLIGMASQLNNHAQSLGTVDFVPAVYDSASNAFTTFAKQFDGAYTAFDHATGQAQLLWHTNANTFSAMQFLKDSKAIITLPEYWNQNYGSTPFTQGKTYVQFASSAGARYSIPYDNSFEVGMAPMPYLADFPQHKAVIQQGTNIALLNQGDAQTQLLAWLFMKYLMRTEVTMDWAIQTGYLPVRTSAYEHITYQNFLDSGSTFAKAAVAANLQTSYMFYDPAFVSSSRARMNVGVALERIMFGDGNIQQALDQAYQETNLGY